jgi:serine/threonine protein kinase/Ran GTPase-activating protein (RanGAP) involved in mRNA processing and transport
MTYCPACNHVTEGGTPRCGSCAASRPDGGWPLDPRLQTIVAGGQYRVLRRLGAGGFGTVYEVETLVGGLRRALKVLHPERAQDARTRERFINEAIVLEQLNHPNVARCYAAGVLDGGHALYLLLELIDGVPLSSLLEQADGTPAPFDPLRAARVGKQIASGLVAVHASGVLHRDLTPRNVLVTNAGTRDEKVTLVDFGVADALEPGTVSARTLLGTPRFIPPEAFVAGAELDARCDLWQLGAVLHVMLWGTPPGANVPPGATPSAALDALVARLLARDPHDRPASALEACEALARVEHALVDADYADDALALVDALCARPSEQAWASICRFLMSRPDASELVERAATLLHTWPDDLRRAPLSWWQRLRHEGTHPLWLLARTLDLSGQALDDDDVLAMAAQPALASITHLVLADNHIGNRGMRALAAARPFAGLRALTLRDNRITGDAVACLPGVLHHLTRLDLAHNGLGARGAELIAAAPLALVSLDLAGNDIGTRGAEAIAASDTCAALERLSLADNGIGSDGASAIATSRSLARVRELDLSRNRIGPAGAAALALSANVSNLASLSLAQNALGLEGLELLLSSHKFSQLETLDLSSNDIGPQGAMALSASPLVRRVKTLAVADNRLGDAGLAALLGAPFLSGLRSLDTAQNEVTGGGIALFRGAPLELNALELSRNPLGRDGLNALAAALPRLRLRRLGVADCGFPPSAFNVLTVAAPVTLRSLDLAGNRLGAPPAPAAGTPIPVCRLDTLDVSRNALSADGLSALLHAPAALAVTHLAAVADASRAARLPPVRRAHAGARRLEHRRPAPQSRPRVQPAGRWRGGGNRRAARLSRLARAGARQQRHQLCRRIVDPRGAGHAAAAAGDVRAQRAQERGRSAQPGASQDRAARAELCGGQRRRRAPGGALLRPPVRTASGAEAALRPYFDAPAAAASRVGARPGDRSPPRPGPGHRRARGACLAPRRLRRVSVTLPGRRRDDDRDAARGAGPEVVGGAR